MSGFSASTAQRRKVREARSIISARPGCDPAHVWPRGKGGCDHPDCVIPLTRDEHEAFDRGELDVLGSMIACGYWAELAHPIACHQVSPAELLKRLTGADQVAELIAEINELTKRNRDMEDLLATTEENLTKMGVGAFFPRRKSVDTEGHA